MTEREAIEYLEITKACAEEGSVGELQKQMCETAIEALKKIQQYREIGTVEEYRKAKRFKEYFDKLYGTGLGIANWHENGDTEPFDNFYDAAIDWSEEE